MKVRAHILLGYEFCWHTHIFLERIASEVIHPDDIDVNFSGTPLANAPGILS